MMLVGHILKSKGDAVFTLSPNETVAQAAGMLHERRVGCLVVLDAQDKVVGILSERDIVRLIALLGTAALSRPVSACMTTSVIFAEPTETVDALLSRMTDRRIRHLPVCKDDRLLGLVSIGDLVKRKIEEAEAEAHSLKAYIAAG
jgi:CBS domain-containing protein